MQISDRIRKSPNFVKNSNSNPWLRMRNLTLAATMSWFADHEQAPSQDPPTEPRAQTARQPARASGSAWRRAPAGARQGARGGERRPARVRRWRGQRRPAHASTRSALPRVCNTPGVSLAKPGSLASNPAPLTEKRRNKCVCMCICA